MKQKALERGARCTIKKGGVDGEIYSACDIPIEGAFAVRSLPPGQYTAVDSTGGWQHFEVLPGDEWTVLLDGDRPGPTGEPGVSGMASSPTLLVGRNPVITDPTQVAPGEGVAAPVVDTPASMDADSPGVETPAPMTPRSRQRGLEPTADVRVPGGAGAGVVAGEDNELEPEVRTTETSGPDRSTELEHGGPPAPQPEPPAKKPAQRKPRAKPAAAKKAAAKKPAK